MREKRLTFLSVPISGNGIFNNYLIDIAGKTEENISHTYYQHKGDET